MKPVRAAIDTPDRVKEQLPLALSGAYIVAEDADWDYATANTKTHTHCYHIYPAMMIPQVARRLIRLYGKAGELLLDPFCGSGTSLVEARLARMDAIGIDLNPFAVFLARVKTTDFEIEQILTEAKALRTRLDELPKHGYNAPRPSFYNIDYWFKQAVQEDLALLRMAIDQSISETVRDFFLVAFAATVRESSNTRRGEYKLYRIPESALDSYHPQVFPIFWEKLERNWRGLSEFLADRVPHTTVRVYEADTRRPLPIDSESVGLIVTSPPYGDSHTTVAYGQFSRLMLQWLGFPDEVAKSIDRRALGGQSRSTQVPLHSSTLESVVETIMHQHPRRASQVYQFYADFAECFPELTRIVKPLGYACFVVGNRTVKGVRIPTDRILIEIAQPFGWHHITTYHRRIPNKRMPLRNSPSNRPGDWGDTMTHEHIVILQKR
ncbi:MAG: DNA modification methylase [Fimbriimonadales bacterium]|nr:MAG: DNA modification methylase [Fimbriimonadales bacterium]